MSWWSDQGGAGYSVISLTTVGDQQEAPHHHMPGGVTGAVRDAPDSGEINQAIADVAEATASLATAESLLDDLNTQLAELEAEIAAETNPIVKSALQLQRTTIKAVITSQKATIADLEATIASAQAIIDGDDLHPYTVYARAVYPHWDGYTNTLPTEDRPTDFDTATTDPAPDTFASWHSSYQAEWLNTYGDGPGAVTTMNIDGTEVYYLLSEDGATVLPINSIELSEIGVLSQTDQQAIVDSDVWDDISARLGIGATTDYYTMSIVGGGDPVINWNIDVLESLKDTLTDSETISAMGADDVETFSKQVDLLEERMLKGAILSEDLVGEMVGEIADRLSRALSFASAPQSYPIIMTLYESKDNVTWLGHYELSGYANSYSSDAGETVGQGYDEFMRAERAILASKLARASIAPVNGGFKDPRLDVPNLIYRLQSLYETEQEGVSDAGTEELLQLYALLDDYAVMQQMVNETIKAYDADDTDQYRRFMNVGGTSGYGQNNLGSPKNADGDHHVDSVRYQYYDGSNFTTIADRTNTESFGNYNWMYTLAADTSVQIVSRWNSIGSLDDLISNSEGQGHTVHWNDDGQLSTEEMRVFTMFASDYFSTADGSPHPIESLYDIDRPLQRFVREDDKYEGELERYKKTTWDTYSTQLSDAVTQLNQQVQIKQNEIDDASKQQNRHYELGSNALSKMYDMLQSISSF